MALEIQSLIEFLNSIFEEPLKPNQNPNPKLIFVVKNNKTEKKQCVTVYQAQKFFSSSAISKLPDK